MSKLSTLFENAEKETKFSFPNRYLLVFLPDFSAAQHAEQSLRETTPVKTVISARGEETLEYLDEQAKKEGVVGALAAKVSQAIGTEAAYLDKDKAAARAGAGLLAAVCPTEEIKAAAWTVVEPLRPLMARYYGTGGIEHLVLE